MPKPLFGYTIDIPSFRRVGYRDVEKHMQDKWAILNKDVVEADEAIEPAPTEYHKEEKPKTEDTGYDRFLRSLIEVPGMITDETAEYISVNGETFTKGCIGTYRKRAVEEGLITIERMARGPGPSEMLCVLTAKGEEILGKQVLLLKGGMQPHRACMDIMKFFEDNGYILKPEHRINDSGESVDLAFLDKQRHKIIGIEIEWSVKSSVQHPVDNIEKCLKAGFSKVISVVPNQSNLKSVERAAKKRLTEEELSKVMFATLPEFLKKDGEYLESSKRFLP